MSFEACFRPVAHNTGKQKAKSDSFASPLHSHRQVDYSVHCTYNTYIQTESERDSELMDEYGRGAVPEISSVYIISLSYDITEM
jgi:hypothetical protein